MSGQTATGHPPVTGGLGRDRPVPTCTGRLTAGGADHLAVKRHGPQGRLLRADGGPARALLATQEPRTAPAQVLARTRQGTGAAQELTWPGLAWHLPAARGPAEPASWSGLAGSAGSTPAGARHILLTRGRAATDRAGGTRARRATASTTGLLPGGRVAVDPERVLPEHDRTASDLLELVIPCLGAAALRLAGADRLLHGEPEQARVRLRQAIDDLDATILQARTSALGLRLVPPGPGASARGHHARPSERSTGPPRGPAGGAVATADRRERGWRTSGTGPDRAGSRAQQNQANMTGRSMVANGSEQPPDHDRHQDVADLLRALPGHGDQLVASLEAVLRLAHASCPTCVAVSLTLDHQGQPVTVAATLRAGHRHAPSMTVQLPRPTTDGPARRPANLVVFATDARALARLAAATTVLLELDPGRVTLTGAAAVPAPATAGPVLAGQLADRSVVDRALGALLEQGWVSTDGRDELQRRADRAGASLVQAATTVLAALPGLPPRLPS